MTSEIAPREQSRRVGFGKIPVAGLREANCQLGQAHAGGEGSTVTIADVLVLAAAGSYVVGYLIINQVVLRLFVLAGTGFYVAYYAVVAEEPLWTAIWTSVALALANFIGLWLLLGRRSRRFLPAEVLALYDKYDDFRTLPPGDFRALINAGHRHIYDAASVLVREDAPTDTLFFILTGSAVAEKRGHRFELPSGIFVGEVAYLLRQNASATITVPEGTEVITWDFDTLQKRSGRPRFKLALEAMISRDLSRKVAYAVAPFAPDESSARN